MEDRIRELDAKDFEITQLKKRKGEWEKNEESLCDPWDTIKEQILE